eukprot:278449_1
MFGKAECEQKFDCIMPKPSYHPTNKDVVIINYGEGLYEYNTKRNTFNKIYTYKQGFEPDCHHGQFIDAKNQLLYIFGYGELGIFDLNTKVMNTNTESALRD